MITIRRAAFEDAASIATIHLVSWYAQFEPILTPEQIALKNLDEHDQIVLWEKRLSGEENASRYTFVAEDANGIVGYITGCQNCTEIADYHFELHQIYIQPDIQRRGIGSRLIREFARHLVDEGHSSLIVWVMTISTAVAFYRDRLKGKWLGERVIPEGDGLLKEEAYGWSELSTLMLHVE